MTKAKPSLIHRSSIKTRRRSALPGWGKPEVGAIMPVGGAPFAMGGGSGGRADEPSGGDTPTGRGGRGSAGTADRGAEMVGMEGMGGIPGEGQRTHCIIIIIGGGRTMTLYCDRRLRDGVSERLEKEEPRRPLHTHTPAACSFYHDADKQLSHETNDSISVIPSNS